MQRKSFRYNVALGLLSFVASTASAAPPPLTAYGDLPALEDMTISDSGKKIAFAARIRGERRLIVIGDDRKPAINAPLADVKLRSIRWAGDSAVLVVVSHTENLGPGFTTTNFEAFQTYSVPVDGSKPDWIFARNPDVAHATFGDYGVRQINGRAVGFFAGIELAPATGSRMEYRFDHGRPAMFSVDVINHQRQRVGRSAPENHSRDWLVDGEGKIAATLDLAIDSGNWEISNAAGQKLASGNDKLGDTRLIAFDSTGTQLIYSIAAGEERETRWMQVPLAGGAPVEYLPGIEVERLFIDRTNGRAMGYMPDDGTNRPVLNDPAKQTLLRKVYRSFPKLHVTVMEWTPSMSHVLLRTSGNSDPGTWYLVDLAQSKADPIGDERPTIPSDQVGPISTVAYKAADGMDIDGILTLPPGREAKNLPVILLPHGGPRSHDVAAFDWWAQAFASRGYAVFQPNFRGSTNRDEAFRNAGNGEWGRKMQTDISDGLAELVRQGIADPRRACIMGASYGGYAALAGVTLQQGIYRCSVAVAPVSDLKEMDRVEYRESGDSRMTRANVRELLDDPKGFDAVSPRRRAAEASAPILLIHGKDDTVVPFRHSSAMASALRSAGKPVELIELKEEDHWLSRSATRQQMLEEAMRFIQQHNPAD